MQLILLTHSREIHKSSNTGKLIAEVDPTTQTIIWQRTEPDEALLKLIAEGKTALVYQHENAISVDAVSQYEHLILIDSTWQEARKIYNRSPYLHDLPCIQLTTDKKSRYNLRRNQLAAGLCTAECAIELFKQVGQINDADLLEQKFLAFINVE